MTPEDLAIKVRTNRRFAEPRAETKRPPQARLRQLEDSNAPLVGLKDLVGVSENWLAVKAQIAELARFASVTVLIVGETGTGKDLVAQALHTATFGRQAPFVPCDCSAIPEHLLESELFGYEQGAFTSANRTKKGLLELAHGGTLFLDEIGELSPTLQPKLLRVLETKSFTRLGATQRMTVDFRLLCATNRPLRTMLAEGKFREDLFHRISTFTVAIAPLRERSEDIPALVEAFIAQANLSLGQQVQGIAPEALAMLRRYSWPGNVREVRNCIERAAVVTEPTGRIEKTAFVPEMFRRKAARGAPALDLGEPSLTLQEAEKQHLTQTLAWCRGNKSQAAKVLDISRTTLRKKLKDYSVI